MAGNPYQRPGFKDPRQSPEESASALSSYFQGQADKKPKTFSPYSAPADSAGGPAPMGGGSAGAASAPKAAQGGGTGFVSFGQYFGGNAPAVQAQAQKVVQQKPISSTDPYAAQIAQTSAQFAALNPAVQSGDMGENVGAFDQLLGGGETQRAAKQEQQRLEASKATIAAEEARRQAQIAQAQAQQNARARAVAEQGRGSEAQQMREEERPDTRKQQSERRGSRFDDYFGY